MRVFLLQEFIEGIEVEVPFFNIRGDYIILDPIKISTHSEILTSELSDNNDYIFESLEDSFLCEKLKAATQKLAQYLGITTYGRVDFRIKSDRSFFVFDVATMPYTTKHSSFNYNFEQHGLTLTDVHKLVILSSL